MSLLKLQITNIHGYVLDKEDIVDVNLINLSYCHSQAILKIWKGISSIHKRK